MQHRAPLAPPAAEPAAEVPGRPSPRSLAQQIVDCNSPTGNGCRDGGYLHSGLEYAGRCGSRCAALCCAVLHCAVLCCAVPCRAGTGRLSGFAMGQRGAGRPDEPPSVALQCLGPASFPHAPATACCRPPSHLCYPSLFPLPVLPLRDGVFLTTEQRYPYFATSGTCKFASIKAGVPPSDQFSLSYPGCGFPCLPRTLLSSWAGASGCHPCRDLSF